MMTAAGGKGDAPVKERIPLTKVLRRRSVQLWLPVGALAAVCAALCALTWLGSYDDAYITYTFARNLAVGKGWTWGSVRILGTSSPLFAALLAGLEYAVPLGVPVWGHLVTWTAALGAAIGLFSLGRR